LRQKKEHTSQSFLRPHRLYACDNGELRIYRETGINIILQTYVLFSSNIMEVFYPMK
jgi:hypothetical protein